MSFRLGPPLIPGAFHLGFRDYGPLGASFPASADGDTLRPGFGYPSIGPGDQAAEVCFVITRFPSGGAFDASEDTSFSYLGAADSFDFKKLVYGVDDGTATASLNIGGTLVGAGFPQSYAILASDSQTTTLVGAGFPQSYAILSEVTMSFTPSAARTVKVQAASTAFTVDVPGFWKMDNPKRPKGLKDPDATFDVSFDWSDWLTDCADAIALATFSVAGGLVNAGSNTDGPLCTVFVSGGTVGGVATVTCHITTASSPPRLEDRTIELTIEDR